MGKDNRAYHAMLGEAAHRRHVLALLAEWTAAVGSAHTGDYATVVVARLIETGDKLAEALSVNALGVSLEGEPHEEK